MKRYFRAGLTNLIILVLLFSSVNASPLPVSALPAASAAQDVPEENFSILLQYGVIDTRQGEPALEEAFRLDEFPADQPGYYLVQFSDIIQPEWKASLEAAGAEVFQYVPNNTYVVRMTGAVRDQVAALPNVQWVGIFQPAYRVSPAVNQLTAQQATGELIILTFPGAGLDEIAAQVQAAGGQVLSQSENDMNGMLTVAAGLELAPVLARINGVMWIEPRDEFKLDNIIARGIMDVQDTVWSVQGLYGEGQTVAVADTGLDVGSFGAAMNNDFEGRITSAYALGRASTGDWSDPHGHGTHVAGSVLGNGRNSGSVPTSNNYNTSHAGVAPKANLIFQSTMDATGKLTGIPTDLNNLFQPAYNDGARIHTNSWGSTTYNSGQYTSNSYAADQFMWNNQDFTILFSAGNNGKDDDWNGVVDLDSIGAPGSAKNVITVGATENNRPTSGLSTDWYSFDFYFDPIASDPISNNQNGMAAFSSRGPTDDGRIKPDVVAPGANILSARSALAPLDAGWGELPGSDPYYGYYLFNGGTSMSTPLVAGGAALIREYYTDRGVVPSSALIKATLINGAVDIQPGQYGTGAYREIGARPNNVTGWGRANLQESLFPSSPTVTRYFQAARGDNFAMSTGRVRGFSYQVTNTSVPLRVTMAYTDYPGTVFSSVPLVNDIDLEVRAPNGVTWYPNGRTSRDSTNNVEDVVIPVGSVQAGTYTVYVRGYNVPQSTQGYGLVVRGGLGADPTCYNVATAASPASGGSVGLSSPNCGGTQYLAGTAVTAQAFPNGGYSFSNWSTGSSANPLTFVVSGSTSLTAYFNQSTTCYSLSTGVSPSGSGSVSVLTSPNCGSQYLSGTSVTVQANPAGGYAFSTWSGSYSSTTNPLTFTITNNTSLTANFQQTGPSTHYVYLPMMRKSSRFDFPFNGSANGWVANSGTWYFDSEGLFTGALDGAFATASYPVSFTNIEFEAEMLRLGCDSCSQGVILRGTPYPMGTGNRWNSAYAFYFTRDGSYSVWRMSGGSAYNLAAWTYSSRINTGDAWNTVRVIANGSSLRFYMNGYLIWSGTNTSISQGVAGLAVYGDPAASDLLVVDWASITDTPSMSSPELNEAAETNPAPDPEADITRAK